MDVDDEQHPSTSQQNAVAGPSTMHSVPPLFLPPPGPSSLRQACLPDLANFMPLSGPPRPPPYFRSTDDLLKRFELLPAYDKYVRPFAPPVGLPNATDKGKGKEIFGRDAPASSPAAPTPAAGNEGDEEDGGKGEKKLRERERERERRDEEKKRRRS